MHTLVISGGSALCSIELDEIGEHCFRFEINCSIKFWHLHIAFKVKLECFPEDDVAQFGQQRANELATERVAVTVIESAQTHLLVRQHFCLNLYYLLQKQIVVVAVVNRVKILKIDLENVRGEQFDIFTKWTTSLAI